MTNYELAILVLCLAGGAGYLNARFLRLPTPIGLMVMALLGSLIILGLGALGLMREEFAQGLVAQVDFANVLMHQMLGLLLFAGALHVDITELASNRRPIIALALVGTLISTAVVGAGTYAIMRALGQPLALADAFLFGALISPTDPIAVLSILKSAGAPQGLAVQVSGESLFNDGIGVVLVVAITAIAGGQHVTAYELSTLFAREVLGGALFGFALGGAGTALLRRIDDYSVEVLITLGMVLGGYAVAERLHVSAPIASVVAGLIVGNQGRRVAMSDLTRRHVDMFWELVDEMLNAVLFLMIGLEATLLHVEAQIAVAALLVIPLVLLARFTAVGTTLSVLKLRTKFPRHAVAILTWSGLRGGISVALALSVRAGHVRETILVLTYAVVATSILGPRTVAARSARTARGWITEHVTATDREGRRLIHEPVNGALPAGVDGERGHAIPAARWQRGSHPLLFSSCREVTPSARHSVSHSDMRMPRLVVLAGRTSGSTKRLNNLVHGRTSLHSELVVNAGGTALVGIGKGRVHLRVAIDGSL